MSMAILFLSGVLLQACATSPKRCKSYEPVIPVCSPGFEYVCETTRDGCYICGCVPIVDEEGRSPMQPPPER
jgi:hypothetical protein